MEFLSKLWHCGLCSQSNQSTPEGILFKPIACNCVNSLSKHAKLMAISFHVAMKISLKHQTWNLTHLESSKRIGSCVKYGEHIKVWSSCLVHQRILKELWIRTAKDWNNLSKFKGKLVLAFRGKNTNHKPLRFERIKITRKTCYHDKDF